MIIVLMKYQVILTCNFKIIDFQNYKFTYNQPIHKLDQIRKVFF